MSGYNKLDTHSSMINNQRIIYLFIQADKLGLAASSSQNFNDILKYYDILEQIYLNVKDIFDKEYIKLIEENRKQIVNKLDTMKAEERGFKLLRWLLRKTKRFNSHIITALQKEKQFFFRQSGYNSNFEDVDYHEDSVFTTNKKSINTKEKQEDYTDMIYD